MVAKQSSRQFVCAALLLLVAACGGEQPDNTQSIFDNPPADASNVTVPSTVDETGDTTSEQTTTTTVVVTTTTDVETDAETSGGDVPDDTTTTTTIAPVVEETPEVVVESDGAPPWLPLNPATAAQLVGWSHVEPVWDYDGGIGIRLNGWSVTPSVDSGSTHLDIGLSVTLIGDYTTTGEQFVLSLLPPSARESGEPPAWALVFFPDRAEEVFFPSAPIDPAIWPPVLPGEERQVSFQWTVPSDAARVDATVGNDMTYSILPQQQGRWGSVLPPAEHPASELNGLFGSCFTAEKCSVFGMDGFEEISLRFYWEPPNGGIAFQLSVRPPPTTREGMTNTDLSAWYEPGGEVWHPVRDAWERYVKNRGETQFSLRMPVLEQPMYIQWDTPGGTVLVWKTVATLRETLFSNPDWVWEAEVPEWAEYEAILAADRICWAHWTGADPYELFPMPVDAGDGTTVEITDGMIAWVVEEVCQQ